MVARNVVQKRVERIASVLLGAALGLVACSSGSPLSDGSGAPTPSQPPPPAAPGQAQSAPAQIRARSRRRPRKSSSRARVELRGLQRCDGARAVTLDARGRPADRDARRAPRRCSRKCNPARSCGSFRRRRPRRLSPRIRRRARARCSRSSLPARDAPPTEVPLPLRHTDVRAVVTGYISRRRRHAAVREPVRREDRSRLPVPAAGERRRQRVRDDDRRAARSAASCASERRRSASTTTRARRAIARACSRSSGPNIFKQKVANIEPGKRIDVNIRYFHTLAYEDGWYAFVFPTVVGPRYNPPGSQRPRAPLCRAQDFGNAAAGTAVRYLRPTERSAHDIGISVDVDAGVAIEELTASHADRDAPRRRVTSRT